MSLIQFKNFRRFPDDRFYKIPYKDITILVGKNNSGKSTMVKALLLVIEYLKSGSVNNFDFANLNLENTNIVTFGRAKNKNSNTNVISFALELQGFTIEIDISGDDDDATVQVDLVRLSAHEPHMIEAGHMHQFLIIPNEKKVNFSRYKVNLFKAFGSVENNEDQETQSQIDKIENQISGFKKDLLDLDKSTKEFVEKNQTYKKLEDKLKILKKSIKKNKTVKNEEYSFELEYLSDDSLQNILKDTSDIASRMTKEKVKNIKGLSANQADKPFSNFMAFKEQKRNIDSLLKFAFKSISDINIYYLPSNPAKQSALFRIKDKQNALAQAIHEFYQITKNRKENEAHRFIKKWMDNEKGFEIGEDIEIIMRASEAYELNVIDNGKSIPLADKGMGSIQAMLLIIRIAVIVEKTQDKDYNPLVIIEEPELNLHPALQSRLCDFFLEVYEKYNIQFIIESHSEYLIRKSQVFVKEREYEKKPNNNPFSVMYFDKFLDNIYEMRYREDGRFENEFGKGFYDEAANLTLDLL